MQIRSHQMVTRQTPDFQAIAKIARSFQLPDAEEFVCDDEEVREACSELEATHESFLD